MLNNKNFWTKEKVLITFNFAYCKPVHNEQYYTAIIKCNIASNSICFNMFLQYILFNRIECDILYLVKLLLFSFAFYHIFLLFENVLSM